MKQEDIEFIKEVKRSMNMQQHQVDRLWDVYLNTYGKYPNFERKKACGRCVQDVINQLFAEANNQPAPNVEEQYKDSEFKPADTLEGKRKGKRKDE